MCRARKGTVLKYMRKAKKVSYDIYLRAAIQLLAVGKSGVECFGVLRSELLRLLTHLPALGPP